MLQKHQDTVEFKDINETSCLARNHFVNRVRLVKQHMKLVSQKEIFTMSVGQQLIVPTFGKVGGS